MNRRDFLLTTAAVPGIAKAMPTTRNRDEFPIRRNLDNLMAQCHPRGTPLLSLLIRNGYTRLVYTPDFGDGLHTQIFRERVRPLEEGHTAEAALRHLGKIAFSLEIALFWGAGYVSPPSAAHCIRSLTGLVKLSGGARRLPGFEECNRKGWLFGSERLCHILWHYLSGRRVMRKKLYDVAFDAVADPDMHWGIVHAPLFDFPARREQGVFVPHLSNLRLCYLKGRQMQLVDDWEFPHLIGEYGLEVKHPEEIVTIELP